MQRIGTTSKIGGLALLANCLIAMRTPPPPLAEPMLSPPVQRDQNACVGSGGISGGIRVPRNTTRMQCVDDRIAGDENAAGSKRLHTIDCFSPGLSARNWLWPRRTPRTRLNSSETDREEKVAGLDPAKTYSKCRCLSTKSDDAVAPWPRWSYRLARARCAEPPLGTPIAVSLRPSRVGQREMQTLLLPSSRKDDNPVRCRTNAAAGRTDRDVARCSGRTPAPMACAANRQRITGAILMISGLVPTTHRIFRLFGITGTCSRPDVAALEQRASMFPPGFRTPCDAWNSSGSNGASPSRNGP